MRCGKSCRSNSAVQAKSNQPQGRNAFLQGSRKSIIRGWVGKKAVRPGKILCCLSRASLGSLPCCCCFCCACCCCAWCGCFCFWLLLLLLPLLLLLHTYTDIYWVIPFYTNCDHNPKHKMEHKMISLVGDFQSIAHNNISQIGGLQSG